MESRTHRETAHLPVLAAVVGPSAQLTAPPDFLQLFQGLQRLLRLLGLLQALQHAATAAGAAWWQSTLAARLGSLLLLLLLLLAGHFNQACHGVAPV